MENNEVQAQGIMDLFSLLDRETIEKVKSIIAAVDQEKIKAILDTIQVDKDGWLRIKVDLGLRK